MHITELRIRNFRNFMKARFFFTKGANTLIGENGSGKTNAFFALRLLLDESLPRNAAYLRESDICRGLNDWKGHWIVISVQFADLDPSEGCQLIKHAAGHMDGSNTGTYSLYFRPKSAVRQKLYEIANDPSDFLSEALEDYRTKLTIDDYEPFLTGRASGDLLDDDIYKACIGDIVNGFYPNPDDDDQDILGVKISPIYTEFTCTFIQALRDVVAELRNYRNSPLLGLLRGMESTIQIADAERITNAVAALNNDISSLTEIKDISAGIQTTLHNAIGQTYSPGVSIESSLPDSMEKLLQRLSILVSETPESEYKGEIYEQSLGGANLIYIALKLLEYESKLAGDRVAHFLLIEEPEAHIHTHVQKTLFANIGSNQTQVIVSTHSTHISSVAKISSVNILAKKEGYAEVYQPAKGLETSVINRIERYLDAVRSTLLFAKGVVLVEGEAELIMIPAMLQSVFGLSPDELGISVVAMNSAFFEHVAMVFSNDRINRRCAIVTDLDQSMMELPEDPNADTDEQKHARAAQNGGQRRRKSLDAFCAGNPWVKSFFIDHTFEVGFIAADNTWEVKQILDHIFDSESAKNNSEKKLDDEDPKTKGKETLRLATKVGKGWFALLLSEALSRKTFIPEYILQAIAFASTESVKIETLKQIGLFRLAEDRWDELEKLAARRSELEKCKATDFLAEYRHTVPNDELSKLCNYLDEYCMK